VSRHLTLGTVSPRLYRADGSYLVLSENGKILGIFAFADVRSAAKTNIRETIRIGSGVVGNSGTGVVPTSNEVPV